MEGGGRVSMAVLGLGVKVVLREEGINEVDRGINSGFKITKDKSVGKM